MKKFLLKLSYTVFPLWAIFVGLVFYISLYVAPRANDFGALTMTVYDPQYRQMQQRSTLKKIYFRTIYDTEDLKSIQTTVITIGDSFSDQRNEGYQNYLGKKGLNIVNCYTGIYNNIPINYGYYLLKNDIIDSTNTKVLILEMVERSFTYKINRIITDTTYTRVVPPTFKDRNKWSLTRARDFIMYRVKRMEADLVYNADLDNDFFLSNNPRSLYFHPEDLSEFNIDEKSETNIRTTFKSLFDMAKEKGIMLILMIAVDKFDLYQDHIVNNIYPVKKVNEDLEKILGSNPNLLLTKHYLLPYIEKGEKDIFKYDDSHWSYKGAEIVAEELYKRIKEASLH